MMYVNLILGEDVLEDLQRFVSAFMMKQLMWRVVGALFIKFITKSIKSINHKSNSNEESKDNKNSSYYEQLVNKESKIKSKFKINN